jgi:PAS domain S-box-containing protein
MPSETMRILLIDDNEEDCLLTEKMLEQLDERSFDFDCLRTYREGKVALQADAHDLYLLDYMLDEGTGLELLKEVDRSQFQSPVIMLTGKGSFSVDVEAMQLGVNDYLDKSSVTPAILERAIRYAMDRVESRRALVESEERHRSMFSHLPIGLFRCTPEGGFIDANPALIRLLGYPDQEALENTYAKGFYVGLRDRGHFLAALDRLGMVKSFETQLTGRDGRTLKLRTTARVHRTADGEVAYVEGAVEDVTEAWPTVAFYQDAARFQRVFRAGPLGLISVSLEGVIQDANPAFLRASGFEVGELIQTEFTDLWEDGAQSPIRQNIAAMVAGNDQRSEGQWSFRRQHGALQLANVTMALVSDWDDDPDHILVMIEPIPVS